MTVYSSEKVLPYIYLGIHSETKAFYIGFRCKNVKLNIPSNEDLGIKYFTSSKVVQKSFHDFDWIILAEFFDATDAYLFEQQLILEHFNNPLNLNKFHDKSGKWSTIGISPFALMSENEKAEYSKRMSITLNSRSEIEKAKTAKKLSEAGRLAHSRRSADDKAKTTLKKLGRKCYTNGTEDFFLFGDDPRITKENLSLGRKPRLGVPNMKNKNRFHDHTGVEYMLDMLDPKIEQLNLKIGRAPQVKAKIGQQRSTNGRYV